MSLFDYMNFGNSSSTGNSASSLSSTYQTALQQLTATQASTTATTTSSSSTGVTISASATIAAAIKADATKDAATLTSDIRSALDAQYKANGKGTADLSAMSPRAVSTIILNSSGKFSATEVLAAKAEMRARDRSGFLNATANDFSVSSLQAYQTARLQSYAAMSVEERTVRGAKS
jgi:hypothetical protein